MRAISFASTCPLCGKLRSQHGYESIELAESLTEEQTIDAYCLSCDVVWAINAEERSQIARLIARRGNVRARTSLAQR